MPTVLPAWMNTFSLSVASFVYVSVVAAYCADVVALFTKNHTRQTAVYELHPTTFMSSAYIPVVEIVQVPELYEMSEPALQVVAPVISELPQFTVCPTVLREQLPPPLLQENA